MSFVYKKGNILESPAYALVNTVNTEGVMGKGLALQFKEAYPLNYKLYRQECKSGALDVGKMFVCEDISDTYGKHLIINFPTKRSWRRPSEYSYIEAGLQALKTEIEHRNIKSLAIPPLGSCNGGLQWERVKTMIEQVLSNVDCEIYIYEPSQAIEEKMKQERVKLTPARAMLLDVLCDIVSQGEFVSEFEAEKVAYFLQRFGATDVFKLKYSKAKYGPYSGKVKYVLHYLNGSYLKGMSDLNNRPFDPIWITSDTAPAAKNYLDKPGNERYKDIADITKEFLSGFASAYGIEILSTIDFILQNDKVLRNWRNMDRQVVIDTIINDLNAWNERKQRMFNNKRNVELAFNHLVDYADKMTDLYS